MDQNLLYVGTKIIKAIPKLKDSQEGYQVTYPDGYISWSPKQTFEECYRRILAKELKLIGGHDGKSV